MIIPRLRLLVPALVGATLVATPVIAQSDRAPQRTVNTSDLNLATPRGAALLHRRVQWAAESVCTINTSDLLRDQRLSAECRRTALKNAQPQVDLALANARDGTGQAAGYTAMRVANR